jgi:CelD/BcsL family acetyltransferase involved in cellulose biosynthesis
VTEETLDGLYRIWSDSSNRLSWHSLFVLPPWLNVWISNFGDALKPTLRVVRTKDTVIGVAPLVIDHETCSASFIGDASVCDYLDFVILPGQELEFFVSMVRDLRNNNIRYLNLESVPEDSSILTDFKRVADNIGCRMAIETQDVAMAIDLPESWDTYLIQLPGKQRHEIRRKYRRLYDAGEIKYALIENPADIAKEMDTFLELFKMNRPDKAAFMTQRMRRYFQSLGKNLSEAGMLKLFKLQIDGVTAAVVMCFDYQSTRFLYNNAYDDSFKEYSVGLMSKVMSMKNAIESRLKRYDFLKGDEIYKQRLGGKPIKLFHCRVELG